MMVDMEYHTVRIATIHSTVAAQIFALKFSVCVPANVATKAERKNIGYIICTSGVGYSRIVMSVVCLSVWISCRCSRILIVYILCRTGGLNIFGSLFCWVCQVKCVSYFFWIQNCVAYFTVKYHKFSYLRILS